MRKLVLILCLAIPSWAASFTASATGNWHNPVTWGNAPGSCNSGVTCPRDTGGDVVTINSGVTLTCEAGQVCAAGTWPTDDTGTVALQCSVNTNTTSVLAIYGTFKYQGPVRQCKAVWTAYAGATITYDSSGAATPGTAYYSWTIGQTAAAGAQLTLSGTSASHVTWNSADGSRTGIIGGAPGIVAGNFVATYADFSHIGHVASNTGFKFFYAQGTYTWDNVTCDDCSDAYIGWYPAMVFHVKNSKWTNCSHDYSFNLANYAGAMTGERTIQNSSLCALEIQGGASATGFTLSNLVLTLPVGSSAPVVYAAPYSSTGSSIANWDGVLLWDRYGSAGPTWPTGSLSYGYYYMQQRPSQANYHGVIETGTADAIFDHWITQYTGADVISDFYQLYLNKAFRAAFRSSIFLPNASTEAPTTIFNDEPTGTALSNAIIEQTHTTAVVSANGGDAGPGICSEANGGSHPTWYAGTLAALSDNIFWRATTSSTAYALRPDASGTINTGAFANVDYNRFYNVTSSGTVYSSSTWPAADYNPALSSGAGVHDTYTASLPPFVDRTRSLLNYDQLALGASVAPAWQTSTAYTAGTSIVSTSSAGFFGGATFNWRARQTHTSSSTNQPETGSSYEDYWEPAALETIRASAAAGQPAIHRLIDWVRAGFTPTTPLLWCAASDGETPGAVKFCGFGRALLAAVP